MSRNHTKLDRRRLAALRWHVLRRDGFRCRRCGRAGRLEVHHQVPIEAGGAPYDDANCITLCRGCHIRHHQAEREANLPPDVREWRSLLDKFRA